MIELFFLLLYLVGFLAALLLAAGLTFLLRPLFRWFGVDLKDY